MSRHGWIGDIGGDQTPQPRAGDGDTVRTPAELDKQRRDWDMARWRKAAEWREGLLQIELSAGKNASYEEQAGNYDLAQVHRRYAQLCKAVRMGQPAQDLFKLSPSRAQDKTEQDTTEQE